MLTCVFHREHMVRMRQQSWRLCKEWDSSVKSWRFFSAASKLTGLVVCPRPAVQQRLWQNKYCSCVMLGQKWQGEHYFQERAWSAAVPHHQVTPTWSAEWEWHLTANESYLHGPQGSTGSPAPTTFNAMLYNGAGRDIHVISRPTVTEFQIWEYCPLVNTWILIPLK